MPRRLLSLSLLRTIATAPAAPASTMLLFPIRLPLLRTVSKRSRARGTDLCCGIMGYWRKMVSHGRVTFSLINRFLHVQGLVFSKPTKSKLLTTAKHSAGRNPRNGRTTDGCAIEAFVMHLNTLMIKITNTKLKTQNSTSKGTTKRSLPSLRRTKPSVKSQKRPFPKNDTPAAETSRSSSIPVSIGVVVFSSLIVGL